jgi:hypothetical protein
MNKMKITDHGFDACSIRYSEGECCFDRLFVAPTSGGYVREVFSGMREGQQVCERLSRSGVTLTWNPKMGRLSDLIRKEYKKKQRQDKRMGL